jgi:predicted nicotinamide N-methyase
MGTHDTLKPREKRPFAIRFRPPVGDPATQSHRLLARIQRRYRTLTETFHIAGRTYPFTRVADPNRVLDQIAIEEDRIEKVSGRRKEGNHLHLPYWAELWDSALAMGEFLTSSPRPLVSVSPCRVLDLGCGMGFTGMIAASLGHRVTFADLEPPALLFAKLNSLRHDPTARVRQLNWETARLDQRFDLILGADILYERAQWEHLERFWRDHLARDGRLLLGEPGRKTGDEFPAWIVQRAWKIAFHEQSVATRSKAVRLFELRVA